MDELLVFKSDFAILKVILSEKLDPANIMDLLTDS